MKELISLEALVAPIAFVVIPAVLVGLGIFVRIKTPRNVRISRSVLIHASPEVLFPYINDPRLIQEWNSFMDGDPTVQVKYSGAAQGEGASWSWEGKKAGIGTATLVTSEPNRRVAVRLDFIKPFHVTNYGEYRLVPQGTSTEAHWTIDESALIPRVLSNFINLEKLIGGVFEKGLARLKTAAEGKAKGRSA